MGFIGLNRWNRATYHCFFHHMGRPSDEVQASLTKHGDQIHLMQFSLWATNITIENGHLVRWFTHKIWWFSIVMLVYQRGSYFFGRWPLFTKMGFPWTLANGFSFVLGLNFWRKTFTKTALHKTLGPLEHIITGWWFGTWILFFHILGIIIPTDEVHHFSEGLAATTNQIRYSTQRPFVGCSFVWPKWPIG